MSFYNKIAVIFLFLGLQNPFKAVGQNDKDYLDRVYFKAKFEPKRQVLNGAGQSPDAFQKYVEALPDAKPVIYMNYYGLKKNSIEEWVEKQEEQLKKYPWMLIPQIGLSMTRDGKPEEHYEDQVAAGEYDEHIDRLCIALKNWRRPVFLRIGYEFNGHWNGYQPETYKAAFIRIVNTLRKHKADNVATVWNFATDGNGDFMSYYPGADYIDWWGIDVFGETHFSDPKTKAFLDSALAYKKPVIIGESAPRRVGVLDGQKSWDRWFAKYFEMIHNNPHIKAFCYINWNWATYPQWADWGDGRIEGNEVVLKNFKEEMSKPLYFHGGNTKSIEKKLSIAK